MSATDPPDAGARVDLHNHLIPGVDDGARDVAETLDGVARLQEVGVRRIVCTPHFAGGLTTRPEACATRLAELDRGWETALSAVRGRFPTIELLRGAEVKLDHPEVDFQDPRLRLAGTSYALVEWSGFRVPPESARTLAGIREQGVRPVVAHPERYDALRESLDAAVLWRAQGAVLQVNAGSLLGGYGPQVRKVALALLEAGYVDCVASDFHPRPDHKLYVDELDEMMSSSEETAVLDLLIRINPGRILADREVLEVPPLSRATGVWGRIRAMLRRIG